MIPARVAAREMRLIEVNSTIILFCDYFGTLLTRHLIEVNCVSLSKTNSGIGEKIYTILFYLGGGGGLRNIFCAKLGICCCQLIALCWNVIAKST